MDFIPGRRLDGIWQGLTGVEKREVVEELWGMVRELRALKVPEGIAGGEMVVGSAETGGPVRDGALTTLDAVGPFKTITSFHETLRGNSSLAEFEHLFRSTNHNKNTNHDHDTAPRSALYKTVFTHADLCPRNLIRGDDGKLYIIDWEFAGWWPGYWEYVKWHFSDFPACPEFVGLMDEVSGMGETVGGLGP